MVEGVYQLHYFAIDPSGQYAFGYNVYDPDQLLRIPLDVGGTGYARKLDGKSYAGLRGNGTGMYFMDTDENKLVCIEWDELISQVEVKERLTIVNVFTNERLTAAIEMFNERYPEIEVVLKTNDNERQIMTQMMAGDGEVDILFTQAAGGTDSKLMADAGAVINLANDEEFMRNLTYWYDVAGLIGSEDFVYGVVCHAWPYTWAVNENLITKLGCEKPEEGWTWDEFFELGRKLAEYNMENGTRYGLLSDSVIPYLIMQYNNNEIDLLQNTAEFDNATLRSLMIQWKEMVDLNLIDSSEDSLFTVQSSQYVSLGSRTDLLYPPVYNADTRWPINSIIGVLNSNCENVEAGIYFMTCYISPDVMTVGDYQYIGRFLKDKNSYPESAFDQDPIFDINPNEENMIYWENLLENSVIQMAFDDVQRCFCYELYPQYINDEIDLDTMLRILQQRADMMLGE